MAIKPRIEVVRSAEACMVDVSLVCEHHFMTRQLLGLCLGGYRSLEAKRIEGDQTDNLGVVGWFNAAPHADQNGVLYVMPILAAASKLTVGRDSVLLRVGEVVRFDDRVRHKTVDSAPALALIYEDGQQGTQTETVLAKFDAVVTRLCREVISQA